MGKGKDGREQKKRKRADMDTKKHEKKKEYREELKMA